MNYFKEFFIDPWAILPMWFEVVLRIENELTTTKTANNSVHHIQFKSEFFIPTQNNFAILPITGVILPTANLFSQLIGATPLDQLTQDFQQAIENPAISEIILHIDSPGGVVTGVHACAEMIYQSRGKKPITAYVSGCGASAAYWLASACDEIVIDATASVGSIGVLSIHTDDKQKKAQQGLIQTQIVSSQSPRKRLDVATDEGRADIQAQVDAIAAVFIEKVALYRNVSSETVLADFGQGSLCVGQQAVTQGLADRVGSLTQRMQTQTNTAAIPLISPKLSRETTMTEMTPPLPSQLTTDYLTQHHPDLLSQLQQQAAQHERERIQAVEAQRLPGHEALIQQLKFDGKTTGAQAAVQILAAEKRSQAEQLAQFQATAPAPLPIHQSLHEATPIAQQRLPLAEQCRLDWEKDAALHAEFGCLEVYQAFKQADAHGQINQLHRS